MNNLLFKSIGYNCENSRQKDDYYATPPETTAALLRVEKFFGDIYEPCCGEGHMSKVLIENGYNVISSDLVNRGYGESRIDFLMETKKVPNIITNPPYKNAIEFAEHAMWLAQKKVALLLKLNFLEGVNRKRFFESFPPKTVHVFSNRQSLRKNGKFYKSGMMALAWFVWEKNNKQPPIINWIET